MGLTASSSGLNLLREKFNIDSNNQGPIIALAGNPNTGKSTIFNNLTGLKQHTGNWPGKTVTQARGFYKYKDKEFTLVDLPGTYSLLANSTEEKIARDFICFAKPDATIVVADVVNLERNLNLLLQVNELTEKVVLCLNMMDEAERKNIQINLEGLKKDLKIPIVPTIAREGVGLLELKEKIHQIVTNELSFKPYRVKYSSNISSAVKEIKDELTKIPFLKNYINLHWLSLRILEGDKTILKSIKEFLPKQNPKNPLNPEVIKVDKFVY